MLASACAKTRPPLAASQPTDCEQLLKATIVDSIERDKNAKIDIAKARAGEQIAQGHEKAAEKIAAENEAWRRWGPIGLVGAFVIGATGAIIVEERRR